MDEKSKLMMTILKTFGCVPGDFIFLEPDLTDNTFLFVMFWYELNKLNINSGYRYNNLASETLTEMFNYYEVYEYELIEDSMSCKFDSNFGFLVETIADLSI